MTGVSSRSQRPPGSAHWLEWARRLEARSVSSSAVPPEPSPASTSAIATAARFRPVNAGSLSRVKAAQHAAIFRRVASLKGRIIQLDYNTPAIDERRDLMVRSSKLRLMPERLNP